MKKPQRFLKLDYTTALIVGTVLVLLFCISIIATHLLKSHYRTTRDHTKPLVLTNQPYCNGEKLDLTVPSSAKPVPLVIYVHGGGWIYGSKVTDNIDFLDSLIADGFAVASINYRLSGTAKFPAAVQDVLCSVRFMRANHELFNIDPQNIALVGYSSGGNLAALGALASNEPNFTSGGYQEYDSNVQAVITLAAHLDLSADNFTDVTEQHLSAWIQTPANRPKASPINYIDSSDPSVLILHAKDDDAVPYSQAESFKAAANAKGYSAALIPVENGGHSFSDWLGRDTPDSAERLRIIETFLLQQFNK